MEGTLRVKWFKSRNLSRGKCLLRHKPSETFRLWSGRPPRLQVRAGFARLAQVSTEPQLQVDRPALCHAAVRKSLGHLVRRCSEAYVSLPSVLSSARGRQTKDGAHRKS